MKDDIQSLLKNFTEADFALLIIAGKDKDGHKRDGLILNGRLDKAIVNNRIQYGRRGRSSVASHRRIKSIRE